MKTFFKLSIITLSIALLFSSCKNKKSGSLTINVATVYNTQNLALNSKITDGEGRKFKFERFQYYLSHITLVKTDNSEIEVEDVVLIDLTDPNSMKLTFNGIKGDFKGIKFGAGLDSIQNTSDPFAEGMKADDPLANTQMYWSWIKYIFQAVEAKIDTTTTGTSTYDLPFLYHVGGDRFYKIATLNKGFEVCCDENTTLTLTLDMEKVINGPVDTIDIFTENFEQSEEKSTGSVKFANNFYRAFTLQ